MDDDDVSGEAECLAALKGSSTRSNSNREGRGLRVSVNLFHMDLAGPMETTSIDKKRHPTTTIDDYTRAVWVDTLESNTEVAQKVKDSPLETAYSVKVQGVMTDNGTEFVNVNVIGYLKSKHIKLFNTVPYTLEQNGVAEKGICTITEGAAWQSYQKALDCGC